MQLIWHGTAEEYSDFLLAMGRNCACDPGGARGQVACGAHQLLMDQRTVDRLLFARRIVGRLHRGEYGPTVKPRAAILAQDGEARHA
jgi:hypothetical protein